jgi:hypothetical protein
MLQRVVATFMGIYYCFIYLFIYLFINLLLKLKYGSLYLEGGRWDERIRSI